MGARTGATRASAAPASPSRQLAFRVLRDVSRRRGEPAGLLDTHAVPVAGAGADRDLATEIVYGVLRWQARLDHVLAHHSQRPLRELHPTVRLALRIGLYQILHLSRVPARAAVDESVRLARAFGASRASGYVNAVLRSVLRDPEAATFPDPSTDPLGHLATALSHPSWLAARYLDRLGFDGAKARCRVQNEPPPTYCRVSRRLALDEARAALARQGVASEPVPAVPGALRILEGRVQTSDLYRSGAVVIQEAGAQLVPLLLDPRPGDTIVDVCAAPGGKAFSMAEGVEPGGRVVALDRRPRRVSLLRELAGRVAASNLFPVVADGRALPLRGLAEKILLDAPCTSLGTLRRNPDIKWRVTERDLESMAGLQLRLLRSAARSLAPGGRLVYATCSTEPEENEDVVARFESEHPEFERLDAARALPEAAHGLVDPSGAYRTLPERDDLDGYYAVILTRGGRGSRDRITA